MPAFIQSIGTALPPFATEQAGIADFMVRHLDLNEEDERNLRILYRASGIQKRYSVLGDFYAPQNGSAFFKKDEAFPSAKPRMELYQREAIKLAIMRAEMRLVKKIQKKSRI